MSLKAWLRKGFELQPEVWKHGCNIEHIVANRTINGKRYAATNCDRRLRELVEEGFLEQKQVKGEAYYKLKGFPQSVTGLTPVESLDWE